MKRGTSWRRSSLSPIDARRDCDRTSSRMRTSTAHAPSTSGSGVLTYVGPPT